MILRISCLRSFVFNIRDAINCVSTTMQNLFLSFLLKPTLQAHYQKAFLIIEKYSIKIFDNKIYFSDNKKVPLKFLDSKIVSVTLGHKLKTLLLECFHWHDLIFYKHLFDSCLLALQYQSFAFLEYKFLRLSFEL